MGALWRLGGVQFTNHEGKRCSTSNAYLRGSFNRQFAAMNRPNLTVACLCHVMRVVTAAKRAVGVTYVLQGRGSASWMCLTRVPPPPSVRRPRAQLQAWLNQP